MFSFAHFWLVLLFPLPILVKALFPGAKKTDQLAKPELVYPRINRLKNAFSTQKVTEKRQEILNEVLCFLLWACLVLAIMQPELIDRFTSVKSKGYDLMLAVDLSGSMKALDFSTEDQNINRLDVTKAVVTEFVKQRQGDRIGLILFGDNAYLHVPLTLDTMAVSEMLNNAVIGMAGESTAIGDAIGLAVKNLRDRPENSRVIILLTDGANTAEKSIPPVEAAKLAKQYGIRIYTIGVGSHGQVPFPDSFGRIIMAEMDLDEDLLQEIAIITAGQYFRATDASALQKIYKHINKLEKTDAETREFLIRNQLYRIPLGIGIVLLFLLALLPMLRKGVRSGF